MKEIYIVAAKRTPIGSFGGKLSSIPATKLGAIAIKAVLNEVQLDPTHVDEVFMGNVLPANLGQAPARQAAIFAGLHKNTPCTTINKVCSSGMKSIIIGVQSILSGDNDVVLAGGMENMSSVPYYAPNMRFGSKLGDVKMIDGLVTDGLTDVYNEYHMGNAAELCANECNISRADQDAFAIESYKRSKNASEKGLFKNEITPVEIPQRRGEPLLMEEDEEFNKVNLDKIPNLRPVFQKEGTVTAANASTLNDGAAAVILMSKEKAKELGIKPLAKIIGYADAAQEPEHFTTAPSLAIPKALKKAKINLEQVDYIELNEAFSVVGIANTQKLDLNPIHVNVNGGAVSLGHPLGCSGTRILVTLINVLKQKKAKIGVAGICNGGGGASAIVIESMD